MPNASSNSCRPPPSRKPHERVHALSVHKPLNCEEADVLGVNPVVRGGESPVYVFTEEPHPDLRVVPQCPRFAELCHLRVAFPAALVRNQ